MISNLQDEEAGQLIKAICNKRLGKKIEINDKTIEAVFIGIFEKRLDEDKEKYNETCEKRRDAAAKRWGENANACKSMQMHTNALQMDGNNKNKNKNNNNYIYNKYFDYKKGNYNFEELERETKGKAK